MTINLEKLRSGEGPVKLKSTDSADLGSSSPNILKSYIVKKSLAPPKLRI